MLAAPEIWVIPSALSQTLSACLEQPRPLAPALSFAARRARRRGRIDLQRIGLALDVHRTSLHGRPYDVITRRSVRHVRVVGLLPASRGRTAPATSDRVFAEREAELLALELLGAESEAELDQFLGKVFSKISKAAQGVSKGIAKITKPIGRALDTINRIVPVKAIFNLTPVGMALRAGQGLSRIARGENVFKVAGNLLKSGVKDLGQAVQLASTVASFVPGVGTGVATALGAAGALAQGKPITEAVLAAAKSALPGGALAAAAFDVASGLARGRSLSASMLDAARSQLPGGAAARAAFDAGLALAQGKKLQDVARNAAGTALRQRFPVLSSVARAG